MSTASRLGITLLAVAFFFQAASAQQTSAQQKKKAKKPNPVFADPEVDPSLPNVLLIGDSISIGYTLAVRSELKGKANVFRPPTNCGPTTRGLDGVEDWLRDKSWDVIHWNFGLHDLKYMGPKGQNLAEPDAEGSHQQVPIDAYTANIESLARTLKDAGKVVIWRQTSPVPEGAKGRVVGDSVKYNEAAGKAIAKVGGIQTDPFYDYAISIAKHQKPANVHYSPEGSKLLGKHVAEVIMKSLK